MLLKRRPWTPRFVNLRNTGNLINWTSLPLGIPQEMGEEGKSGCCAFVFNPKVGQALDSRVGQASMKSRFTLATETFNVLLTAYVMASKTAPVKFHLLV